MEPFLVWEKQGYFLASATPRTSGHKSQNPDIARSSLLSILWSKASVLRKTTNEYFQYLFGPWVRHNETLGPKLLCSRFPLPRGG